MNKTLSYLFEAKNYNAVMHLKIFVDNDYPELKQMYTEAIQKHNERLLTHEFLDAGFDLFTPEDTYLNNLNTKMIDCKIKCSAQMIYDTYKKHYTGYSLYPRSSIYKTPLILANSIGVIDSGYRNFIMGAFKVIGQDSYLVEKNIRLLQICSPTYCPIYVELVQEEEELSPKTERNLGGFGST
jgi:dUTP pyrophosphatase